MAITTTLAACSTNPALNGPDGATDLPSLIDDAIRYSLSFTAQLRDGTGFTAGAIVAGLGFTPVQQGGGTGQGTNKVYIGWLGTQLGLQVDASNYGASWPISINGNAATATTATNATNATNATTAANATALGGQAAAEYIRRGTGNVYTVVWDSVNNWVYTAIDGAGAKYAYTHWDAVQGRPTDLASFSNGPGYVQRVGNSMVEVGDAGNSGVIGRAIPCTDTQVRSFRSNPSVLIVNINGSEQQIALSPSDARLKTDVAPTQEDSLAKVRRIAFNQFRYTPEAGMGDELQTLGVIAQQLERIDAQWSTEAQWKAPNVPKLVYAALHAIAQQAELIDALQARVAALEAAR
jgi:hypothetical protein